MPYIFNGLPRNVVSFELLLMILIKGLFLNDSRLVATLATIGNLFYRQNSKMAVEWRHTFLCPRHKMARGHLVFALSVLPSFRPSVTSKFVFSTPPTSLHGFQWNLAGMLYHKSGSACGEIIHVWQISAELWSLTLRICTYFSLSSQLLLHRCMDFNETWQGCCSTSLEVHVGR